jgi:hypothetical protein
LVSALSDRFEPGWPVQFHRHVADEENWLAGLVNLVALKNMSKMS